MYRTNMARTHSTKNKRITFKSSWKVKYAVKVSARDAKTGEVVSAVCRSVKYLVARRTVRRR